MPLAAVALRPRRLADLRRSLPAGLANQVLLTQLRALTAAGLVESAAEPRGCAAVARRYRPTPLGWSVLPVLDAVAGWGAERLRARGAHWTSPVPHPRAPAAESAAGAGDHGRVA
jgi:DNA-binding HxlR family transcriptional regulator